MDAMTKDVLSDGYQKYLDYVEEDLEKQFDAVDDKEKQYYSDASIKTVTERVIRQNNIDMEAEKDMQAIDERREASRFSNVLHEKILEDPLTIKAAQDVRDKKRAAEYAEYEKEYAEVEKENPQFQKPIDECDKIVDDLFEFNKNTIQNIVSTAREKLVRLKELAEYKSDNSTEFKHMIETLQDVTTVNTELSAGEIMDKLIEVRKAAEKYVERIDSSWFRGVLPNGKARRAMADEIGFFAVNATEQIDTGLPKGIDLNKGLSDQLVGLYARLSELQREKKTKIDAIIDERHAMVLPKVAVDTVYAAPAVESEQLRSTANIEEDAPESSSKEKTDIGKEEKNAGSKEKTDAVEKEEKSAGSEEKTNNVVKEEKLVRNKMDLASLQKEEQVEKNEGKKMSPREELLKKREEIMEKRRENEKAGIPNDGWENRKK
ncbi:MAG: hypothetical protein IJ600_01305 [Lachnospiraceae bacterium]|nr:hypothetical protein [Lachnospiraceae bacterium]